MDASFDPTFMGMGNGWNDEGNNLTSTQIPGASSNTFDRVPLPVQINDVLLCRSQEDKIQYGAYAFGTLRVCGRILTKEEQSKETMLEICDPTETDTEMCERLKVVVYQSAQTAADYNEGDIVVALGKVRKFDDVISFVAFGLTVQSDPRLAESFKLEAKLAKLFYEKNIPERIGQGPCTEFEGSIFSNVPFVRPTQSTGATQNAGAHQTPGGYQPTNGANNYTPNANHGAKAEPQQTFSETNRGLTGLKEKIFNAIRSTPTDGETGLHVSDIKRIVGPNAPTFQTDLQYLVNEGVIYNTIDDDHFAAI